MAMGQRAARDVGEEPERKKLDLSAAQVAGSSLATVAAALLASKMGVYGTILGAGVVSVVATAGGPVIQHFFRRTGDRLRGSARTGARSVPTDRAEQRAPDGALTGEFGEATVHGTRVRGWKRTAVASGAAFALAIGGLGTYEAMAGTSVSSGGGTLFSGGTRTADRDRPAPPPEGPGSDGKRGRAPGPGTSPSPSDPQDGRSPGPGPSPSGSGNSGGNSGNSGASGDPKPSTSPSKESPSTSPAPAPPAPPTGPDASTPAAGRSTP
ncbi:hypothetical protein ACWGE1_09720 [Streptomyces sp. NPDC054932]